MFFEKVNRRYEVKESNIHNVYNEYDLAMCDELKRLLKSPEFIRSPVMSRLLIYITEAALSGKMGLKAYEIAVDGLGRQPDFDPAIDSYPRVQIGRLRRTLESYYARHPDQPGPCLHVPTGSYRVRLSSRSIAYPQIVSEKLGYPHSVMPVTAIVPPEITPRRMVTLSFHMGVSKILIVSSAGLFLISAFFLVTHLAK